MPLNWPSCSIKIYPYCIQWLHDVNICASGRFQSSAVHDWSMIYVTLDMFVIKALCFVVDLLIGQVLEVNTYFITTLTWTQTNNMALFPLFVVTDLNKKHRRCPKYVWFVHSQIFPPNSDLIKINHLHIIAVYQ